MFHQSHDWLRLARELGQRPDETAQRSAISRAYYAAYHCCLAWERLLPAPGADAGSQGVHSALIARLEHPHRGCSRVEAARSKALGKLLRAQRTRRATADYKWDRPISADLVDRQLEAATRVMRECDHTTLRRSPPRPPRPQ